MRCERAQELFSDYCEETLQHALVVPLEGHLAACADCREQVEDLKTVWQILDSAPPVEPPPGFRALVWQRIEAEEARRRQTPRPRFAFNLHALFTRPALGWAAAALLLLLLAPVVIPGRFAAARMVFPWSLFYTPPAPARLVIDAPGLVPDREGRLALSITARNTGEQAGRVDLVVESGPVEGERARSSSVAPGERLSLRLGTVQAGTATEPIRLRATWEQDGQRLSRTFIMPAK